MTKILIAAALLSLVGCSAVTEKVLVKFDSDMDATIALAEKYESPAVLQCAKFLKLATVGVKELADEPTAGIFSSAFKSVLLRRMGESFEDAFAANCGGVAARVLVELGRKAPIPGR